MTDTYDALIRQVCDDTPPVPFDVLKAMMLVESNGNPKARSKSDARGLCQLIPKWHATGVGAQVARQMGKPLTDDLWYDPEFSLRAGALHLRWCYTSDGWKSWERAVRKYHSGSADPPAGFVDGQGTSSDAHIRKFRATLAAVRQDGVPQTPTEDTDMALNFDPKLIPFPKYENRYALAKVDGTGQDDFGRRTLRGNVWHRGLTKKQTLDQAVSYLIAPTTEGLTDGYIDNKTGRLIMMNPMEMLFDDLPDWWEDRAGWANGVYGKGRAPSADAAGFVAAFGYLMTQKGQAAANIINQDLESYELLGEYEDPISEACKATMVQIAANRAQRMKIPYDVWPLNPATGTVVHFGHSEFTLKECPGKVVWAFINGEMVTRVREKLRIAQTGSATAPIPAPQPTPMPVRPVITGPVDAGMAAWFFGEVVGDDGFVYRFDPNGIVSKAWLERGKTTGQYPELVAVYTPDTRKIFHFSDGSVLIQPNPRSGVEYIAA